MKPTMQIRTKTAQGCEPRLFTSYLLLGFILALAGCDSDANTGSGSGTLEVTLSATGDDLPFTFVVRVAGRTRSEAMESTLTFSDLAAGDHEVSLLNITNCQVQGSNPRTVTIPGTYVEGMWDILAFCWAIPILAGLLRRA